MSSNYGTTSVNTFIDNKVIESSNGQNSSIALSQDNSNVIIFGNDSNSLSNLNTDYSSACDNVFNDNSSTASNNSSVPNYMSKVKNAFAGYENTSSLFDGIDYSAPYNKVLDNFFASISKSDEGKQTEGAEGAEGANEEEKTEETKEEEKTEETKEEEKTEETKEESETEYTEEEQIAIYNAVEDILDASVRMPGTDEKSLVDVLSDENLSPKLMKAVQEELTNQGYDIFDIIRSETSGSTEDVLEGYALAKLGGKTKETKTELESYEKYENMNKDSVEYQKYIRNCMSLFRQAVNGPGTDEKVLTYIMSLPEDIRSDVEAKYNEKYSDERDFMQRGKDETGGLIHTEFYN